MENSVKKKNVVIVDDETDISGICAEILEGQGYAVKCFTDAESLLKGKTPPMDLLITDINLHETSGLVLAEKVRAIFKAEGKTIPVLFISGFPTEHLRAKSANEPDVYFLDKPFRVNDFLKMVTKVLPPILKSAS